MSVPQSAEGSVLGASRTAVPVDIESLAPPGALLVIAPHPDDETLGCGQALSAAAAAGRDILLVLLTDGEASTPGKTPAERNRLVAQRLDELRNALSLLAPGKRIRIERTRLPDGKSTPCDLAIDRAEELLVDARKMKVAAVWSTWRGDPHCDHQTAAIIGRRLAERLGVPFWTYPVWGRFGERPHPGELRLFADDSAALRKQSAMQCYRSQLDQTAPPAAGEFRMPPALVDHFATHPEIFFREF
ncbi:PIG-L deacetylase family protein [Erythrobacter sp.]|jgi:LmbE family N-acetylglucosaminyl deacetylase|uniref:PIG-L deacetylase family protein n=1 Tax=Erythrobacter sp. TaxID=1042 RepID=UPI002ED4E2AF